MGTTGAVEAKEELERSEFLRVELNTGRLSNKNISKK